MTSHRRFTSPPLQYHHHAASIHHRHCFLDRSNTPSSALDLFRHPPWFFDPDITPTLHLGPVAIPALAIPLTVSTVFLYMKPTQIRQRNVPGTLALAPRENRPLPRVGAQALNLNFSLEKTIFWYHGIITSGAIMRLGRSFLPLECLACSQVKALLAFGEFVRPETGVRTMCLAGAAGWALLGFLDCCAVPANANGAADSFALRAFALWPWAAYVLVALAAAPLAWQIGARGRPRWEQRASGTLLMLNVGTRLVFGCGCEEAVGESAMTHRLAGMGVLMAVESVNGGMVWVCNRRAATVGSSEGGGRDGGTGVGWDWDLGRAAGGFGLMARLVGRVLGFLAVVLGLLAGGVGCTAFLASCLPWNSLLWGKCAEAPGVSRASSLVGIGIYVSIWATSVIIEHGPNARHGERNSIEMLRTELWSTVYLLGWSCCALNVLWVTAPGIVGLMKEMQSG